MKKEVWCCNLIELDGKFFLIRDLSKMKFVFPFYCTNDSDDVSNVLEQKASEHGLSISVDKILGFSESKTKCLLIFKSSALEFNSDMELSFFSLPEIKQIISKKMLDKSYLVDAIEFYLKEESLDFSMIRATN